MEKHKKTFCFFQGCNSTSNDFSLFQIPQLDMFNKKWKEFLIKNNQPNFSLNSRLCELHFKTADMRTYESKKLLIPGSYPVYKKGPPIAEEYLDQALKAKECKQESKQEKLTFEPCRICLRGKGTCPLRNNISNSEITVLEAIKTAFDFELIQQPTLPQKICNSCYKIMYSSYSFKRTMIKSDRILRGKCDDYQEPTFHPKRQKLEDSSVAPDREMRVPPPQNSYEENVTFYITEIPDNVLEGVKIKTEKQEETEIKYVERIKEGSMEANEKNAIEPSVYIDTKCRVEIKTEEEPKTNVCKKCKYQAKNHLSLLFHIDISTRNCIELYDPKNECLICHRKFMLIGTRNKHIQKMHAGQLPTIKLKDVAFK